MAMFTDTITLYNKISDSEWKRTVVNGVHWAETYNRINDNGKNSVTRQITVTFPNGTFQGLLLEAGRTEDAIVFGVSRDIVSGEKGSRISDLLKKHSRSGIIQTVNDNSNRDFLPNVKVVLG